ncbi:hypothetical protein EYF80_049754 [Liparis tanakae]|uniref:Uncharacterized protein n=1 Tax=Liparis tanakae TaxID=230148 RepID=A0A4Z2FIG4_9TELE|nr:hypothetical protein EYF80_049754 [Liparis tanakae]
MPAVGGKGRKCPDTMTVFNQENVEGFYEFGDELGSLAPSAPPFQHMFRDGTVMCDLAEAQDFSCVMWKQ